MSVNKSQSTSINPNQYQSTPVDLGLVENMVISREELQKKGWTDEEIDYTFNVIDTAKDKKTAFIHFLDGAISWFGLFMVFLGSLILSVVIMPFFLTVRGFFLYFMVFILAFVLGIVFNFLLDQINQLGKEEKIVGEIFLPVISLIDVYVMFGISSVLINTLRVTYESHNQIIFGVVYVVSLSGPFYLSHSKMLIDKYFGRWMKNASNGKNNPDNPQTRIQVPDGRNMQYNMNVQAGRSGSNANNMNVRPDIINSQQDYYQMYLEDQKKQEARKMLYERRLKERLLERLNK